MGGMKRWAGVQCGGWGGGREQGAGAPRCFRSCLGCKREILELTAPQGSQLPTLEGSAARTINLA